MRVLVTDATYKHALAAVRALGTQGFEVIAGSSRRVAQSFYSRYCMGKVVHPDPRDEARFIPAMLDCVRRRQIDVLLPIGYQANVVLSRHKDEFSGFVRLPVADWQTMQIACDKGKTIAWAQHIGIPTPAVYDVPQAVDCFPVVVKRVMESGGVRYVNSPEELAGLDLTEAVLEEYIPGEGYGFFALFDTGKCRALFMHRRLREYPPTGGASTAAVSIDDPTLRELGIRLLESLSWHGVAMVEFRKDGRDGQYKLMEINPKFWGSLDLAIASGVNFPCLAARMAAGFPVEEVFSYRVGQRFRWFWPDDLLHLLARPASLGAVLGDMFRRDTRGNFSWRDPAPNLFQALASAPIILSRAINGNLRRPHGAPDLRP